MSSTTLRLYRSMLRAARGFSDYNFKAYAVRRTQECFRNNRNVQGEQLEALLARAVNEELPSLRRMATVNSMYASATPSVLLQNK